MPDKRPRKIGLTQRVDDVPGRPERRDGLDQAWAELLGHVGFLPVPLPNQPQQAQALVQGLELDGIILTGGNDLADVPGATHIAPERDAFERELLDLCTSRHLPVLGVCRGMQMVVCYFGGKIGPVENHVQRPHLILARDSRMPTLPRPEVNSFHGFGTRSEWLPADLTVAGVAPDDTVEAVAHRSLPIWAHMWHPERPTRPGMSRDDRDVVLLRTLFGGQHR